MKSRMQSKWQLTLATVSLIQPGHTAMKRQLAKQFARKLHKASSNAVKYLLWPKWVHLEWRIQRRRKSCMNIFSDFSCGTHSMRATKSNTLAANRWTIWIWSTSIYFWFIFRSAMRTKMTPSNGHAIQTAVEHWATLTIWKRGRQWRSALNWVWWKVLVFRTSIVSKLPAFFRSPEFHQSSIRWSARQR